ncbi:MAG: FAD-dependent oxidoreductase, partial [Candidatus Bipolaricaulia bacterium]
MEYDYDVVIVGASFAGLSVASQLHGAVLLIDKNDPGAHQTSACGAPYDLIRELGSGGRTVLLSSHLLHEVEQVCQGVAILSRGRLIA